MITDFQSSEICINRLRIANAGSDPMTTRLRAASLLNAADLEAAQITPSAIVFIRKLRDPLPGVLRFDRSDLLPPAKWNRALSDSLRQIAESAIRPAVDNVTGSEAAILFANPAELLACLARDWCNSRLAERWWWKTLLRSGDASQFVKKFWRDHPEHIPAALQRLARQRIAINFVKLLSPADVRPLVYELIQSFALTALAPVATRIFESTLTSGGPNTGTGPPQEEEWLPPAGPWRRQVPEAEAYELTLPQKFFMGIALMIARGPSVARNREFARAVEHWQEAVARRVQDRRAGVDALALAEEKVESRPESSTDSANVSSIRREQDPARGRRELADVQPALIHDAEERQSRSKSFEEASSIIVTAFDVPPRDSIGTKVLMPTLDPATCVTDVREREPEVSGTTQPDIVAAVSLDESVAAASVEIETQLGGLFYLINLALYLNLYGDFTMPAAPEIELNVWDFVVLAGAELVSDASEADPIWPLLAHLAGRDEEEAPGSSFAPDDEWRLPPQWLSMFSDDRPWRWNSLGTQASRPAKHARGGRTQARSPRTGLRRLRVLHPEGFLVLDLPLAQDVRAQLQSEIKRYDVSERLLSRGETPELWPLRSKLASSSEVRRWLSLLMPYVRARLCLALGLESHQDTAATLCQRYARVRATDTHVNVFFRLADLPLEIRFAGLDRDPGWVPAAGRFITFHFD